MYKQVNNKEANPKETGFYEKILWGISIFLTVLTGAINSVLVIFLLKRIVEVILQDGTNEIRLLILFALSVLAGALLEILRQKLRYILYRRQVIRLEDRLISASCERGNEGNKAFVLIQNTVNDFVAKQTDWVLDCCNIIGVSIMLGIYACTISVTALLICLVITVAALLMMWKSSRKIPDAARASNEKMNAVYGEMWNYLRCKEILPFLRPRVYGKYEEKLEENQQGLILVNKYTNTARICMRFGSAGECLINNYRVESLDRQELWKHILYLPQNPVLLPVSLRGNITLKGDSGQIDEKKYSEALKKAGIEELAAEKGEGELDESTLSSGERQKVCLARCFYTDKEVLILDEATNAMSPGAEKNILHNLINEATQKNKILILVSHNPAVIKLCDRSVRIYKDEAKTL